MKSLAHLNCNGKFVCEKASESLHRNVSYGNAVPRVHPVTYINEISLMYIWSAKWSRPNSAFISNVFILGRKNKKIVKAWPVFSLLPQVTRKQSQPMRGDVTFLMFSLSGWDRFHVTGDNRQKMVHVPHGNFKIDIHVSHLSENKTSQIKFPYRDTKYPSLWNLQIER